jgi:hypothetical protein
MADLLLPVAIFVCFGLTLAEVIRIFSDGYTRRKVLQSGASPELAAALVPAPRQDPGLYGPLKWGLLSAALGLALVVVQFLPFGGDDPIVYGVILLFVAAGLLTYYGIVRRVAPRQGGSAELPAPPRALLEETRELSTA